MEGKFISYLRVSTEKQGVSGLGLAALVKDFAGEELTGHTRFFTSQGLYRPEETRAESVGARREWGRASGAAAGVRAC
jgi:hypothetical protein